MVKKARIKSRKTKTKKSLFKITRLKILLFILIASSLILALLAFANAYRNFKSNQTANAVLGDSRELPVPNLTELVKLAKMLIKAPKGAAVISVCAKPQQIQCFDCARAKVTFFGPFADCKPTVVSQNLPGYCKYSIQCPYVSNSLPNSAKSANPYTGIGGACKAEGGTCGNWRTHTCSGNFAVGLCSGLSGSYLCCFGKLSPKKISSSQPDPTLSNTCHAKGGICGNTSTQNCSSGFVGGECEKLPNNIKCCYGNLSNKPQDNSNSYTGIGGICANKGGKCGNTDTQNCSTGFVKGQCPGPNNVRCCYGKLTYKQNNSGSYTGIGGICASKGGKCANKDLQNCSTGFVKGQCPGASNIQCCYGKISNKPQNNSGSYTGIGGICASKGGTCADINVKNCSSGFVSGQCAGGNNIRCCYGKLSSKYHL